MAFACSVYSTSPAKPYTLDSAWRFTTGKTTLMVLFVTPRALVLARSTGVAAPAAAGRARPNAQASTTTAATTLPDPRPTTVPSCRTSFPSPLTTAPPRQALHRHRRGARLRAAGVGHRAPLPPPLRGRAASRPRRLRSAPHQGLVAEAVGLVGVNTQTLPPVSLVV